MNAELRSRQTGRQQKPSSSPKKAAELEEPSKTASVPYRYGPLPRFNGQRLFSRGVIIVGVVIYMLFSKDGKETNLAKQSQVYSVRGVHVDCHEEYLQEIRQYPGCVPKRCGRYVSDSIVTDYEASTLLWLAKRGMSFGGSSGGATYMDLHSGALSYKENFINLYKVVKRRDFITPTDFNVYQHVRQKIQSAIADYFGVDVNKLLLTHPTFFSRLTSEAPRHDSDEYWHVHVDKHTYKSFHYTALVYLNNFHESFKGGRFVYLDKMESPRVNTTVEPRMGRVSMFTSGPENPHFVERVTEGERFAITISFTCNSEHHIRDPSVSNNGQ